MPVDNQLAFFYLFMREGNTRPIFPIFNDGALVHTLKRNIKVEGGYRGRVQFRVLAVVVRVRYVLPYTFFIE